MPSLHWIGKEKVINHHHDVPFRVLDQQYTFSVDPADRGPSEPVTDTPGNLIIHGDNLEALKALLPQYEGRVKCIYIDPPYNTGNEGWVYNDNVNDPKIKRWLGQVVGKESEDLSRHDKWLCMMYPRLVLLNKLLTPNGVLIASIDENEYSNLKLVLDEIFGRQNSVGTIIWKNANDNNPTNIAVEHEYITVYAKDKKSLPAEWKSSDIEVKDKLIELGRSLIRVFDDEAELQKEYTRWYRENRPFIWPFQDYKFIDKGGIYTGSRSVHNPGKEGYRYDVLHPVTGKPCQEPMMGYRFPYETMKELLDSKKIIFGDDEKKIVEIKLYVKDYRAKLSSLIELDGRIGTNNIKDIFPESKRQFDYPKPYSLLEELFSFVTSENDIVLDSFAGSGTTAHAVINLNKQDRGRRKFILIEMGDYAENITAERVRRVMVSDYKPNIGLHNIDNKAAVGNFAYYTLGERLFDESGNLNPVISTDKIRQYIWFTETKGTAVPAQNDEIYRLGIYEGTAYYFCYDPEATTTLDYELLGSIQTQAEQYIIYADSCTLSDEYLQQKHIIFKKIPRDITRL